MKPEGSPATLVNIHEAKTHFSRLIARVEAGEEVVIARAGHAVARLIPTGERPAPRVAGTARGKIAMNKDFDAPLPARLRRAFE